MYIIKVSGGKEKFNPNKVYRTCRRAGADKTLAGEIAAKVEKQIYSGITTREILRLILNLLSRDNPGAATRYSLKEAILQLGPGGFVFEKFIVRLLQSYGYQAWCPEIIRGACVNHEIDITARADFSTEKLPFILPKPFLKNKSGRRHGKKITYMVECKYHKTPGNRCDLKQTLYTWARFLDVQEGWRRGYCEKFNYPWLISNTKFSQSAIEYAECKGMRLLGWRYPRRAGLEYLIGQKNFYPITILKTLDSDLREKLFFQDIILCQDLTTIGEGILQRKIDVEDKKLGRLIKEAQSII